MAGRSEKFSWLARLGFAARGIVYILIGYLFLTGDARRAGDGGPESAFAWLHDAPGGTVLLYLTAIGLFGYGLFRLASAVFNIENQTSDAKGAARRLGHGASGVFHVVLAWTALKFASSGASSGNGSQEAAGTLLSVSFGPVLLGLAGLAFFVAAAEQAKNAWQATFLREVSRGAPGFLLPLGRAGYAARAVIFVLIGWSLIKAAWLESSSQVMTLGEAIGSLSDDGVIFRLIALGVLLFGVFSLFLARYRVIPDMRRPALRGMASGFAGPRLGRGRFR